MKSLFKISFILFLLTTTSCDQKEKQSSDVKNRVSSEIGTTQSIEDINYETLDITNFIDFQSFESQTETYKVMDSTFNVNYYFKDSSFIKTFKNRHPDVLNLDLVCGIIKSNIHIKSNPIIGISTNTFLNKYPSLKGQLNQNSLTIYQNELGEFWTTYNFKSDTLQFITLSSNYDWVTCQ